jgi:hypothetical protein
MLANSFPRCTQSTINYSGTPTTSGTSVAAGGTSHTLTTNAVELIASLAHDVYWVTVQFTGSYTTAATRTDALLSVYVGAASSEQVLIPNLLCGWAAAHGLGVPCKVYHFPLYIPAGTRVSARSQALVASQAARVRIKCLGGGRGPSWAGRGVECLGADTAASTGTSVTPGGVSEGSFTDIGTSTRGYRYINVGVQGTLSDTNMSQNMGAYDIGVGGAVYQNLEGFLFTCSGSEVLGAAAGGHGRWRTIPSGTALQLRGQVSGTAEPVDCCIYGVY